jgi:peptide/nickel transport system ATP-binding protein
MRQIRGKDISLIFQEPMTSLNPVLTIGFQITEALEVHFKMEKKKSRKRAIELLEKVGIPIPEQRIDEYPHQLSGGMRQRAMIAMALACDPALLIADEPTTSLDVTIQAQILELMKSLLEQYNSSMIMITHDLGVIAEVADRIAVMYAGKIVEYATTRSIFYSPLHPYTFGLLTSIPRLDMEIEKLESIPGVVPDPLHFPEGCKFHPRCTFATEKCRKEEPPLVEIEKNHSVRCWHIEKVKQEAKKISFTGRLSTGE